MNLNRFNDQQRVALLELLSLAMICDSQASMPEGARIKKVAASLGFATDEERAAHLTAVFQAISHLPRNRESFRTHLKASARHFPNKLVREEAIAAVNELLLSDHHLATQEGVFAGLMKEEFAQ